MTTALALNASRNLWFAYVLEIEGIDTAFTTSSDTTGIATAWSGSPAYTIVSGLDMPGEVSREIDLLGFTLPEVSITLRLLDDNAGTIAALLGSGDASATTTYLTADHARDATTLNVVRTALFPASGTLHIGRERITYSGKTATTFTGCSRGTHPWGGKAAPWGYEYSIGDVPSGETLLEVSTKPRVWKGRGFTLYQIAKDTTGTWTTKANALTWFAGTLNGDPSCTGREWTFGGESVENMMQGSLLRHQFTAKMNGFVIPEDEVYTAFEWLLDSTGAIVSGPDSESFTISAGSYTHETLLAHVNEQLAGLTTLNGTWSVNVRATGTLGLRAHLLFYTGSIGANFMDWSLWRQLDDGSYSTYGVAFEMLGYTDIPAALATDQRIASDSHGQATAQMPPVKAVFDPFFPTLTIDEASKRGTWFDMSAADVPGGVGDGYILVGEDSDRLWLVTFDDAATFTRVASIGPTGKALAHVVLPSGLVVSDTRQLIRLEEDDIEIPIRQVWVYKGRVSTIVMRMLMSTGISSYNGTRDQWPASMGLGIPAELVDAPSIVALDSAAGAASVQRPVILEPESAAGVLEALMCSVGFHLVWRHGKIAATMTTTPAGLDATATLDMDNLPADEITSYAAGVDLIRNSIKLKLNRDIFTDEYRKTYTAENLPSQSVHGVPDAFEYEARCLYDDGDDAVINAWIDHVAAPTMAYFGAAIPVYVRPGMATLMGSISCGDIVTLTDDDAFNPATGGYGLDAVKAWVVGLTEDPASQRVTEIKLLVPLGKRLPMGPSGMLDYSRGDFGYDAANHRLYLRDHEFSLATEDTDVSRFRLDHDISIVEIDPAVPGSPTKWGRTVDNDPATDGYIHLSSALSLPAFDSSKRYYVELSEADAQISDYEEAYAWIADADDLLVMDDSAIPASLWSQFLVSGAEAAAVSTNRYRRPYTLSDDDGQPVSPHKLIDAAANANVVYAQTANMQPISTQYQTERQTTGTEWEALTMPMKVYCPPGVETLELALWVRTTNALSVATFRATATPQPPIGTAMIAEFGTEYSRVTGSSTASATLVEQTLSLPLKPGPDRNCYVTIEGLQANASYKAGLRGVSGYFAARSVA